MKTNSESSEMLTQSSEPAKVTGWGLTNKQLTYWVEANKTWNFKIGATGSGKTYMDMFLIRKRIIETTGAGAIVILGNTQSTIQRNIVDGLQAIYGAAAIGNISSNNTCMMFGRKVYVLGADKKNRVEAIQGMTIEYCYGDEVTTWSQEVFEMLKSRLRLPNSIFDGTANPKNPKHWLKKFIDGDSSSDIYYQHYVLDDGRFDEDPIIDRRIKDRLKTQYTGVYYDRFVLGLWADAEGLIYEQFAKDPQAYLVSSKDVPLMKKLSIGVDFGQATSKHAFVATGISVDNKVYALASEKIGVGITADIVGDRYVSFLKRVEETFGMRVNYTYGDSARTMDILSLKKSLKQAGLNRVVWGSHKYKIVDRISGTSSLINQGRLFYTELAPDVKEALETSVWEKSDGGESKRLDIDTDVIDAFEYSFERDLYSLISNWRG